MSCTKIIWHPDDMTIYLLGEIKKIMSAEFDLTYSKIFTDAISEVTLNKPEQEGFWKKFFDENKNFQISSKLERISTIQIEISEVANAQLDNIRRDMIADFNTKKINMAVLMRWTLFHYYLQLIDEKGIEQQAFSIPILFAELGRLAEQRDYTTLKKVYDILINKA